VEASTDRHSERREESAFDIGGMKKQIPRRVAPRNDNVFFKLAHYLAPKFLNAAKVAVRAFHVGMDLSEQRVRGVKFPFIAQPVQESDFYFCSFARNAVGGRRNQQMSLDAKWPLSEGWARTDVGYRGCLAE
jgi:hypothetical protein